MLQLLFQPVITYIPEESGMHATGRLTLGLFGFNTINGYENVYISS